MPNNKIPKKLNVLLLCNYDPYNAAAVCDHINSLAIHSRNDVTVISTLVDNQGNLPTDVDINVYDVIIIHYSLFIAIDAYVSVATRHKLAAYKGIKAIFLQDEYRFIDRSVERIKTLGFDIIFTVIPEASIDAVYPASLMPNTKRVNVLTGYVPGALVNYEPIPLRSRRYHVSYRGRKYPIWHGRLGLEKWHIATGFKKAARGKRLSMNISISEKDRVYGVDWVNLMRRSRAVLGVESGASVFDFDGSISARVDSLHTLLDKKIEYEPIRKKFFVDLEDKHTIAQISPRIFEAIALRTLCVLFEGDYSGVIEPWRHFVPLKKDFSNIDEVVAILKDETRCAEIIATAYAEIAINPKYSYEAFSAKVDDVITSVANQRHQEPKISGKAAIKQRNEIRKNIKKIKAKYMFYYIANPHALARPGGERFIAKILKRILSSKIGSRITRLAK